MKAKLIWVILFSAIGLFTSSIAAQPWINCSPNRHQMQLIREGWRSGNLTHREMRELLIQKRRIGQTRRAMLADGFISPRESRKLNRLYRQAGRNLYRELRDGERRVHRLW